MCKIVKTCRQEIHGLNSSQENQIKKALTFKNPAYANAKRFSKSKYISIPPYLTYYEKVGNTLNVPIGIDLRKVLNVPFIPSTDRRIRSQVSFPAFILKKLRRDQKKAEKAYLEGVRYSVNPKCLIQLPTGKGKSILALHIAYLLKQKTLILVHKDDLVEGWTKDIKFCFGEQIEVGLIKAKKRKIGPQFTIATVQTLNRMKEDELNSYVKQFGFVVQDECHHVGLNIFNIIDKFHAKYKLGLTATPKRTDGLNFVFDLFFGGLCYTHEVTEDDEDICGVEVRVLDSPFDYTPFVYKNQVFNYSDFKEEDLPRKIKFVSDIPYEDRPRIPYLNIDDCAVKDKKTKIMVCKKIIEHYRENHSILALFTQKEHVNLYYRYLKRYIPENQIMLYYGDSKEKSADMMNKAENKEVLVTLATYAKATEGTNVKAWEVEFLVSSVNNEKNVEQATGRIRRRKKGKLSPVIVYDVRYSSCYSLGSHYKLREKTYRNLKYTIVDSKAPKSGRKKPMFTRGY